MRRFFVLCLGMMLAALSAKAQDVYVDTSVLNSLGTTQMGMQNEPMFPVVQKSATRIQKKVVKKKTPEVVVNKVVSKPRIVEEEKVEDVVIPEKIDVPEVETAVVKPIETEEMPAPVEQEAKKETESLFGEENAKNTPIAAVGEESKASVIGENDIERPASPQEAQLLIPAKEEIETAASGDNKIFFAEDDAGLNDVKKSLIDSIVSGFADPVNNKIAIMSYNFDNGEDSFRKKRLSLNRAVEIRSYLLGKGYKNFSIKVINVTDDQSKKNSVEIDEIK